MLRDYQQNAHDAAIAWLRQSVEPCLIEAATGAGKSHIIAAIAKSLHEISKGKHILCLAPSAELVEQNRDKYLATGNPASVYSASAGGKCLRHPVVFGTPGTVKNSIRKFGSQFCAVVVDECFPAGTMISTPNGDKKIELVRSGDIVFNAVGSGVVRQKMIKTTRDIVEVKFNDGTKTRCTKNHPFFTGMGWKPAGAMVRGEIVFCRETLSALWFGIPTEKIFSQRKSKDVSRKRTVLATTRDLQSVLCEEISEPYAQRNIKKKNVRNSNINRAQAKNKTREWRRDDETTINAFASIGERLGSRICCENKKEKFRRFSASLQNRYSKSIENDCNRSGRRQPWHASKTGARCEKRCFASIKRVESVSIIECGSDEIVYNLHVSGHPSYFANGLLVHNCHGVTPTVRYIINELRGVNPKLRVIGTTATPYRLGDGFIFSIDENEKPTCERAKDPYFVKKVYTITAPELIKRGYLTPPTVGAINADGYATLHMRVNTLGKFAQDDIDQAYHGHGRKTAGIIADVVAQARGRNGVMIFAATVQHAHECLASLPAGLAAIVTAETPKAERKRILQRFKARQLKYLVNVSVLTTGFDAPHVDLIAILRATESVGLLQQIIGRGLRIDDNKKDCLILDYAQNVERHCPDGDLFAPTIKVRFGGGGDSEPINAECPACKIGNEFAARENPDGFAIDKNGYFVDLDGNRITTSHGDMPAHHGRRCMALHPAPGGKLVQCHYRWTHKPCPHCNADNDIAARYCHDCKGEIVDPNKKLVADFRALKKDPTRLQTDKVVGWSHLRTVSQAGNNCLRVDYVTEYRRFSIWYMPDATHQKGFAAWRQFCEATDSGRVMPETITYNKDAKTGMYRVFAYGEKADEVPAVA